MRKMMLYISFTIMIAACREKYEMPVSVPPTGYLVVEGTINSGIGATVINMSRTQSLEDSALHKERFAHVRVEGEDNTSTILYETSEGAYTSDQLSLNRNTKYRLHIYTIDDKEYISEYTLPKATPPVDNITWTREAAGVRLFVNSHDPQNNTWFYRWEYDETWEFNSRYLSNIRYVRDPSTGRIITVKFVTGTDITDWYTCWASERSKGILIGSSEKLSRDTIHLPIQFVPEPSWKMTVLYSINIKQYAQSEASFRYLAQMKKNTEQLGTLFDPQPSQLIGNIQCVENPQEPVIGFVEVADLQEKRIFIPRSELGSWPYVTNCQEVSLPVNADSLNAVEEELLPTTPHEYDLLGFLKRFWASTPDCVDCTRRGTNVKPSFWP
jgi:hypothetical protein